jgi:uncharacterized membrane protein YfcA
MATREPAPAGGGRLALRLERPHPRLIAIGLLGGLLSGLLGVGGGTIMVPLLVFWAGFAQRDAHATSLGAIIPISMVSAATLGAGAHIDVRAAVFLSIGAIAGARVGAAALAGADDRKLQWLFGSFLAAAACLMLVRG